MKKVSKKKIDVTARVGVFSNAEGSIYPILIMEGEEGETLVVKSVHKKKEIDGKNVYVTTPSLVLKFKECNLQSIRENFFMYSFTFARTEVKMDEGWMERVMTTLEILMYKREAETKDYKSLSSMDAFIYTALEALTQTFFNCYLSWFGDIKDVVANNERPSEVTKKLLPIFKMMEENYDNDAVLSMSVMDSEIATKESYKKFVRDIKVIFQENKKGGK